MLLDTLFETSFQGAKRLLVLAFDDTYTKNSNVVTDNP